LNSQVKIMVWYGMVRLCKCRLVLKDRKKECDRLYWICLACLCELSILNSQVRTGLGQECNWLYRICLAFLCELSVLNSQVKD